MIKHKFRVILDFDLNLSEGEKLDKDSIQQFKKEIKRLPMDFIFYALHGDYDRDITPTNIKCKVEKR